MSITNAREILDRLTAPQLARLRGLFGTRHAQPWNNGDDELKAMRLVHCHQNGQGRETTELNNLGWTVAMIADTADF
ncbi:hypothetical protein [Sphingopyxis sp. QXT-31]|uniref:hypothetical protein n=1 Tax=Sphingopyxis sp. QXT-31 TaxID=1357916 RepID=UPI0012ECAE45|nr:hypothetical protein [Sphingopyxis sp. QXT-31]